MMGYTDRHYRYLARLMSTKTVLYTEMVHSRAILRGEWQRLLAYSPEEAPLALQVGGAIATELASCAIIAENLGFNEINLNVGCPSERVQSGEFGACLFKQPERVANAIHAMQAAVRIPVTVKTRIAVDDYDRQEHLYDFINCVSKAGCKTFIIHARKAWLKGLSPKQNREIPPLNYPIVYQLKKDFPTLKIIINGGIKHLTEIQQHLTQVDGVMIGREAYSNPYSLAMIDSIFYNMSNLIKSRQTIVLAYAEYVAQKLRKKVPLRLLIKPILNLFQGQPGAKIWRRYLTEHIAVNDAQILEQAFNAKNSFEDRL